MVSCSGLRLASFKFCEDGSLNVFRIPWTHLNFALLAIRQLNLIDEMLFTGSQLKEREQSELFKSCNIESASNFVFVS